MKEELIDIFSNSKLQSMIEQVKIENHFTVEQDISLKSLLLSVYILTRKQESPFFYFETIVNGILQNEVQNCYNFVVNQIIDEIFLDEPNNYTKALELINNAIYDGYCFHSFNSAFLPTIQKHGLVIQKKPWDNQEIETIRALFAKHNKKDIFGLYQGRKNTPLFFAGNLRSSRFYAYSSPTWFRHFVSGGMSKNNQYDKTAFFKRDYKGAKRNVLMMCENANLSIEELNYVLSFFEKNWDWIATSSQPCIALVKYIDLEFDFLQTPPLPQEDAASYTKRLLQLYGQQNYIVKNDINPEKIIIFPYEINQIKNVQTEKRYTL